MEGKGLEKEKTEAQAASIENVVHKYPEIGG